MATDTDSRVHFTDPAVSYLRSRERTPVPPIESFRASSQYLAKYRQPRESFPSSIRATTSLIV